MGKQRLEAFTDGVMAIIITIMVLELKVPQGSSLAALRAGLPVYLAYALSFANVGIFWNNHHHMLHVTERIREHPQGSHSPASSGQLGEGIADSAL